jgi:hypothetical protein
MYVEIGIATSHAQIQSWRESAKEVGIALTMEIWEQFDSGGSVRAHVSVYYPDFHPLWYKLVDKLKKEGREANWRDSEQLRAGIIKSLKETYQIKYGATPEGHLIIEEKKADKKKKDESDMQECFSDAVAKKRISAALLSK